MMLKLKLQSFGHLMRRVDSLEKTLMLGGTGGRRRRDNRGWDGWMVSLTQWTRVWVNSGSWWWTERPGVLWFMGSQRVGHDWATELNGISYSTSLPIYNWKLSNFYFSHSNRYKAISHCGFKVHFPNTNNVESFLYVYWSFLYLLWWCACSRLLPFFFFFFTELSIYCQFVRNL